jgi:protoporphyrinogen oxidase
VTIGILGGGLAGCSLGKLFAERGWSFEILEAENEIGGLLRSANVNGFTFDLGGPHILFSKNEHALEFLLNAISGNVSTKRRNTKVLFKGRFVKYPFENGLSYLPLTDNLACLAGFTVAAISRSARMKTKGKNLREWCLISFGKGISKRYLIPYNEKIWKFPLTEISTGWVERIPNPPWKDVFKSSIGIETEGYAHQLNFHYPRTGGIEAIIKGLTKDFSDKIITGFQVKSISKTDGKWAVSDGRRTRSYEAVVSTIPLPTLAEAARLPDSAINAAKNLKVNSVICVCLGGVRPRKTDLSWLYVPAKTSMAHRVSFLSNSSDMSAPAGKHSLIADMTCKYNDETWRMSDETLVRRTIEDLISQGVLESGDFDASLVVRQRYAYVIDDLDRMENVEILRKHLDAIGLLTCGRFAEFEYLNMDAIVAHAFDLVKKHETVLEHAG